MGRNLVGSGWIGALMTGVLMRNGDGGKKSDGNHHADGGRDGGNRNESLVFPFYP